MLASNFYRESKMGRGRGNKRDTVSVPKLTPGTSTTKSSAARGRGKGRPPLVTGPQRRQILVEVNRGRNHDEADNEVDSEKENENPELDDLETEDIEQEEEEEETEEEFDWKCRLLETIQLYPEVFDLADPRYKDRNQRDAAWEEIATAMEATGQSIYMYFVDF